MDDELQAARRSALASPREGGGRVRLARALARAGPPPRRAPAAACELWRAAALGAEQDIVQPELQRLGALASPWAHFSFHGGPSPDATSRVLGPRSSAAKRTIAEGEHWSMVAVLSDGSLVAKYTGGAFAFHRLDAETGANLDGIPFLHQSAITARGVLSFMVDASGHMAGVFPLPRLGQDFRKLPSLELLGATSRPAFQRVLTLATGQVVAVTSSGEAFVYAPDLELATRFPTGLADPSVAPAGTDRFAVLASERLLVFTTSGEKVVDRGLQPHACSVRSNGHTLFVVSVAPARVEAFSLQGELLWEELVPFEALNPTVLPVRDGSAYCFERRDVQRITAAGDATWRWRAPARHDGVIVDREGFLYIANGTSITALTPDGEKAFEVLLGERATLHAIDAWGRLLATAWVGEGEAELVAVG